MIYKTSKQKTNEHKQTSKASKNYTEKKPANNINQKTNYTV